MELEMKDTGCKCTNACGCLRACPSTLSQHATDAWESFADSTRDTTFVRNTKKFFTKKSALKKLPPIKWLPKYRLKHFIGDLIAGFTVGLTVIPQGLAFAAASGLPIQYGLYSCFISVFVYMIFGTSKDVAVGPTAIMALMIASFSSDPNPVDLDPTYAIVLALIVGCVQIIMSILSLGFIVQFISAPVLSGFCSACAVVIASAQVKLWLGLKKIPRDFVPQWEGIFLNLGKTSHWDAGMGTIAIIILMLMKKFNDWVMPKLKEEKNKPKKVVMKIAWLICTSRNAVVVITCSVIAAILKDIYGINQFTLTAAVPAGLPVPRVPNFTLNVTAGNETITRTTSEIFSDIGAGFFVVAIIGFIESVAVARTLARRFNYRVDANQELLALGLCNIVNGFFQAHPCTGSFSRSVVNAQSGVRTQLGNIWTGGIVILALVVLTPYFTYIPQCSLGAVIICAVLPMIEYEMIPHLWRVKKLDLIPALLTFFIAVFVKVEYGIGVGVLFSVLIIIFPMARPELKITYVTADGREADQKHFGDVSDSSKVAVIIEPNQGLKFPGMEYIKDKAIKHGTFEDPRKPVILNALHFGGCDFTSVQGIQQLVEYLEKFSLTFVIANCPTEMKKILFTASIKQLLFADSVQEALDLVFESRGKLEGDNSDNADHSGLVLRTSSNNLDNNIELDSYRTHQNGVENPGFAVSETNSSK